MLFNKSILTQKRVKVSFKSPLDIKAGDFLTIRVYYSNEPIGKRILKVDIPFITGYIILEVAAGKQIIYVSILVLLDVA